MAKIMCLFRYGHTIYMVARYVHKRVSEVRNVRRNRSMEVVRSGSGIETNER